MTSQFRCELISWTSVNRLARELAARIRKTGFRPETVVAIGRGGWVPARILCDCLNLTDLRSIRIVHYTAGAKMQRRASLVEGLATDLAGNNTLLVDDVSDTGDTLVLARKHLLERSAGTVRIAVLHHKQTSSLRPDFFARRILRWRWLIYPWATTEDIGGFIDRLPIHPKDADQADQLLQQYYGLRIKRPLLEELLLFQTRPDKNSGAGW